MVGSEWRERDLGRWEDGEALYCLFGATHWLEQMWFPTSPLKAIQARAPKATVKYDPGFDPVAAAAAQARRDAGFTEEEVIHVSELAAVKHAARHEIAAYPQSIET